VSVGFSGPTVKESKDLVSLSICSVDGAHGFDNSVLLLRMCGTARLGRARLVAMRYLLDIKRI